MIFSKYCRTIPVCARRIKNEPVFVKFFHDTLKCKKSLTLETVNPNYKGIEYAITGTIYKKALEIERQIKQGKRKPFPNVLNLNIGDPQALGQLPVTFLRQVMTLIAYPELLNDRTFPEDVKQRATNILEKCPGGSAGSYSDACGMEVIRRQIAKYIEKRDNVPSHWRNCMMGQGAADMAKKFLSILKCDKNGLRAGILNPVPEYPFYSATLTELGFKRIDYYLDEKKNWDLNIQELQRAIDEARDECNPRAIIVINPGNPTSHVLSRKNMEEIVKFAWRENLIIIADEVYQNNVLKDDCTFLSFKKVLNGMGKPYSDMELVSLMTVSKGIYAESGSKCGYAEIVNMDPNIPPMFVKSLSASLCPSVLAQSTVYCMVYPPSPNEPSYEQFLHEKNSIMGGLKMSASIFEEAVHHLEGMRCNPIEGSIFFYPSIRLPKKAVEKAVKLQISPDEFYAVQLLDEAGICVVPGSGFRQKPGTYHIRMTVAPDPDLTHNIMERFRKFHFKFMKDFSK